MILNNWQGQAQCWINQNVRLSLGYFAQKEGVTYRCATVNECLVIFLLEGKIRIDGIGLNARDAIDVWKRDAAPIHVEAGSVFLIIEMPINQK